MALFTSINPLYYTISWTVVHSVWQILFLALIGGVVQAIFHHKGAKFRYNLLLSIMGLILLASFITAAYYYDLSDAISSQQLVDQKSNNLVVNPVFVKEATIEAADKSSFLFLEKFNLFIENNIFGIVILWLVGMMMALLRLVGNISYVYYLRSKLNFPVEEYWENTLKTLANKLNINKPISILESALVRAPVVIGHLKPIILFPIGAINRLSAEEVESIIAHELAHIKRNDYLVNIMLNITESIFYFHPAMWWLSSQIKSEREHCCDDMAIDTLGNPFNYAKSLVAVQEMAYYSPQLAMAFASKEKSSQLVVRVNRLISKPTRAMNIREKGIASIFVLTMIVAFAIAARPGLDQQHDCLSSTSTKSSGDENFLKFNNFTIIDSLFVPFAVNDGDFDYNDALHNVKMKIIDRHVVSFNLNGLEIAGTDISKFEKLIFEILNPEKDNEIFDGSSVSYSFGDGTESPDAYRPAYGSEVYDGFVAQLKLDNLLKKNRKNGIHFNRNNMVINGKIMDDAIHGEYVALFEKITNRKIYGDVGMSFEVVLNKDGAIDQLEYRMPEPPSPPSEENHKQHHSKTSIPAPPSEPTLPAPIKTKDGSHFNYSYTTDDSDSSIHSDESAENNSHGTNSYIGSKDEAFDIWLDKQLYIDGYIKNVKQFSYHWDHKSMRVDGLEVKQEDRKKYASKRKEMTGYNVTSTFMKTRNVTQD